jgi:dTDP-4-dehydrorhamnose 3,5-epimerase
LRFVETPVHGAFVIEIEPSSDERGSFARTFCEREFLAHGLQPHVAQCSVSFNQRRGTLRGMHYQEPPHEEAKLVRCTMGAIYDVVIDLRGGSPAYRRSYGIELTPDNRRMLYVPEGCAHGFMTLSDETELFYQISTAHVPGSSRGVRWNDPAFSIVWPMEPVVISDRDARWPLWTEPA